MRKKHKATVNYQKYLKREFVGTTIPPTGETRKGTPPSRMVYMLIRIHLVYRIK